MWQTKKTPMKSPLPRKRSSSTAKHNAYKAQTSFLGLTKKSDGDDSSVELVRKERKHHKFLLKREEEEEDDDTEEEEEEEHEDNQQMRRVSIDKIEVDETLSNSHIFQQQQQHDRISQKQQRRRQQHQHKHEEINTILRNECHSNPQMFVRKLSALEGVDARNSYLQWLLSSVISIERLRVNMIQLWDHPLLVLSMDAPLNEDGRVCAGTSSFLVAIAPQFHKLAEETNKRENGGGLPSAPPPSSASLEVRYFSLGQLHPHVKAEEDGEKAAAAAVAPIQPEICFLYEWRNNDGRPVQMSCLGDPSKFARAGQYMFAFEVVKELRREKNRKDWIDK